MESLGENTARHIGDQIPGLDPASTELFPGLAFSAAKEIFLNKLHVTPGQAEARNSKSETK
jgi:hypothetical protein